MTVLTFLFLLESGFSWFFFLKVLTKQYKLSQIRMGSWGFFGWNQQIYTLGNSEQTFPEYTRCQPVRNSQFLKHLMSMGHQMDGHPILPPAKGERGNYEAGSKRPSLFPSL